MMEPPNFILNPQRKRTKVPLSAPLYHLFPIFFLVFPPLKLDHIEEGKREGTPDTQKQEGDRSSREVGSRTSSPKPEGSKEKLGATDDGDLAAKEEAIQYRIASAPSKQRIEDDDDDNREVRSLRKSERRKEEREEEEGRKGDEREARDEEDRLQKEEGEGKDEKQEGGLRKEDVTPMEGVETREPSKEEGESVPPKKGKDDGEEEGEVREK